MTWRGKKMSKYTTEVRYICEYNAGLLESTGYSDVDNIISQAWTKIFDGNFPIFNEDYRSVICQKILKHYYTREICAETMGLWKLWLNSRMNEIMPYYNQLYESAELTFKPLEDTNITTTEKRTISGNENGNSTRESDFTRTDNGTNTQNGTNYNLFSDTPQGGLAGVDSETYLTTAEKNTTNSTITNNGTETNEGTDKVNNFRNFSNTDEFVRNITGKQGGQSNSALLKEFRETFLNIDRMIIEELSDLFFNLY